MENLMWRSIARILAYIDLVLAVIILVHISVLAYFAGELTAEVAEDSKNENRKFHNSSSAYLIILWILMLVTIISISIDMWAAIKILQVSHLRDDPVVMLRKACIWRNVSIVFLVFGPLFYGYSHNWYPFPIVLIFRIVVIFVVHKFIQELKQASVLQTSSLNMA